MATLSKAPVACPATLRAKPARLPVPQLVPRAILESASRLDSVASAPIPSAWIASKISSTASNANLASRRFWEYARPAPEIASLAIATDPTTATYPDARPATPEFEPIPAPSVSLVVRSATPPRLPPVSVVPPVPIWPAANVTYVPADVLLAPRVLPVRAVSKDLLYRAVHATPPVRSPAQLAMPALDV